MRLRMTNRIYQVISMVVLLLAAVALTTALVVAAERSTEGTKKSTWHKSSVDAPLVNELGPKGWV
jgi:hypothetical protein